MSRSIAPNLSTIHFGEYLNTFVHELHASFDLGSRVQIQLSLADLALAASDALPLGLICNELVSNAIKYAFPDDRCGNISIALRYASRGTGNDESQFCELQIADDGVGLPQGAEMRDLNIEASPQTYARTGGVLYLIIIVVGLFEEAFVRNRLIVSGDATATATNSAPTVFQGGAALRTVSLHGDNPTSNSSLPDLNESAAGTYSREWRIAASNLTRALGRPIRDQVFSTRDNQATTIQGIELMNGETLTHWLNRGARRMLGELPAEPESLFARQIDVTRERTPAPGQFDVDISNASKLFFIIQDASSTAPDKGLPLWLNVELEGPSGSVPLKSLKPVEGSGVREGNGAVQVAATKDVEDRVFQYALGRDPSPAERSIVDAVLQSPAHPGVSSPDGLADLLWAVLMKPEFQLIH
jgi:anti-sigma regulatory factor (Ser/Thr protein kinase)